MAQHLDPQEAGRVFGPLLFGGDLQELAATKEQQQLQTDYFRRAIVKMSRLLVERWLYDVQETDSNCENSDKYSYDNGKKLDGYLKVLDKYLQELKAYTDYLDEVAYDSEVPEQKLPSRPSEDLRKTLQDLGIDELEHLAKWISLGVNKKPSPGQDYPRSSLECDESDLSKGLIYKWNIPIYDRPKEATYCGLKGWVKECNDWLDHPTDAFPAPGKDRGYIPLATT